ncbi:MAG: hypothetical protein CMI54_02700 [Parcubacteria group bacterium]|nr:hypothetical protein [Parcubacteria group bacterium]
MADKIFGNRALLAKVERTYGTDPTPDATNDSMITSNLSITPYGGNTVQIANDQGFHGARKSFTTGAMVTVSFDINLAGSSAAGTVPVYEVLFKSCGLSDETIVASTSVTYAPVSNGETSITMYVNLDGVQHIVTGARGTFSLSMGRSAMPTISFTYTGIYNTPTDVALPTLVTTGWVDPVAINNDNTPTATLDSYDMIMDQFTMDFGSNVVYRNLVNQENVIISGREVTGSAHIGMPTVAAKSLYALVESHSGVTLGALTFSHGTTAANIVGITCPTTQVTSMSYDDSDGVAMCNLGFSMLPTSAGDDEIAYALT